MQDSLVRHEVARADGLLRLKPAWVGRAFLPGGRRLGLPDDAYDLGERGSVCERWLASTTKADNLVGPDDEGLSYVATSNGEPLLLRDAVAAAPALLMGDEYAATHDGLDRLCKIFDYGARIPFHIHPPKEEAAKTGRNSKDESYYFPPGVSLGDHPESFLGLHPSADREHAAAGIVEELQRWDSDDILRFSRAYRQVHEDGFYIPAGVLHAPGTALTIELQEDSDSMSMLQALNAGRIIDKELLYKDICYDDRCALGEAAVLEWIDWGANTDPYFFENHHTPPLLISSDELVSEWWIWYGTAKYSGKKLVVRPGGRVRAVENGVYSVIVWEGEGTVGDVALRGGSPGDDELLVTHARAVDGVDIVNTGTQALLLLKVFGPDLNPASPRIPAYVPHR